MSTRWSGFDWASEQQEIIIVGAGGIGSNTAFSLSRIGHNLILVDDDNVDNTNVTGGQFFKLSQIGTKKVYAVRDNVREFGASQAIDAIEEKYSNDLFTPIFITALDNMKTRKQCFYSWLEQLTVENKDKSLFIDGRLSGELAEVFAIQGNNEEQIEKYKSWLFDDAEIPDVDCTTKQTTFMGLHIASIITATVCNFLANCKLQIEVREVPFHQKFYSPALSYAKETI